MPAPISSATAGAAGRPQAKAGGAAKSEFFTEFNRFPETRFTKRPSGVQIATIREGKGTPLRDGMTVTVHYTGWLTNGTPFDTSLTRGEPFSFRMGEGNVIKGWEEGLEGMKPGERRQLIIPADMAYGERQVGKIPPGSTLIFNIEAVAVERFGGNPNGNLSIRA